MKDLSEYDPRDVAAAVERAWLRIPEERREHLDKARFLGIALAYLTGMVPVEGATVATLEMWEVVVSAFTVDLGGERMLRVNTMEGAINNLQYDSDEQAFEAVERHARRLEAAGATASDWFCPFCDRTWAAGSEPDKCPDCDAFLMRIRVPPEEVDL